MICIVLMITGLRMTSQLNEVYNCGVIDAGLAITKGRKEGSYMKEFGMMTEKKLLTAFVSDLKDFKKEVQFTFDLSYQKLVEKKFETRLEDI